MADEIHLADGTIIDMQTGEVMDPPGETNDVRIVAAWKFLADTSHRKTDQLTLTELRTEVIDLRKLLIRAIQVADDYTATEIDTGISHVIDPDGAVYVAAGDVHRLPADLIDSLSP